MKKITFLLGLMLMALIGFSQTTINYQDFERGADNWNYTPIPVSYNVSGDTWDTVTDFTSYISAPQSGTCFWEMHGLDNPNGGGDFRHTLSFDTIDVPSGTQYVRLQLSARQNGGSDYAGFDNLLLCYGGGGGGSAAYTAFYEPFDDDLDIMLTQNIVGVDQEWVWTNYGNPPGSAKMNGYSGSARDNEDWLITPAIDLESYSNVTLPVVAGNFFEAMGSGVNWDPSNLAGEMSDADSDDVYTLDLLVPTGDWEFKVALNNNWDQSTGGNVPFTSDGVNTTTFTYDFTTNTISVTAPPPPTALVTFIVYDTIGRNYDGFNLKGSWNANGNFDPSWNGGNEHTPFYDDETNGDAVAGDHVWTCQQELVVDNGANTWEWSVTDSEHNRVDGNWQFTVPNTDPQTQTWEVPATPALVINEIMYNSPGADEEWIELYNNTGSSINLENWKVLDDDANHSPIMIPAGYSIDAGGYFTIQISDNGNFPFTPDYDGSGNFSLNNGGDAVRLWNADGYLVDIVNYDDQAPWPTEPDGNGPTLSLVDPDDDNSLPDSWLASDQDGGTPGAINFNPVPFITVIDPNGGESIEQGTSYTIRWSYGYWDGPIEIYLFHGDQDSTILASNVPVSDSSWQWDVFDTQEPDTNYKIKIRSLDPDTTPWDMSDASFEIIEPYDSPDLVITEIMYNPPESGDDTLEFIELYNHRADTVNLEGVYFSEGINYVFPDQIILPDTFVVVAKDSLAMLNTFGINVQQWTSGGLKNSGEKIEIRDKVDNVIDSLTYDDAAPWPVTPDGDGPSLTLCNPDVDNSPGANWNASVHFMAVNSNGDSIWATPGFTCSIQFQAAFQADTTIVLVEDSVQFADMTTGNPTSWDWTFEGGNPGTFSGETPPPVAYDTAGHWDVTLVVSDGSLTDTAYYEEYIWAGEAPVADFEGNPTTVTAGSYANFTNLSTGDELSYSWTFEGATPDTSTATDPQEIYYLINADSLYDVTLVATNVFGSDTMTKVDYIHTIPEGVNENSLNASVMLYPNPASGKVHIVIEKQGLFEISVINLIGKQVYKTMLAGSGMVDMNRFDKGLYFVRIVIQSNGEVVVKKLILK